MLLKERDASREIMNPHSQQVNKMYFAPRNPRRVTSLESFVTPGDFHRTHSNLPAKAGSAASLVCS